MPFSFSPLLWLAVAGGILAGAAWLVDEIGDIREAKVHARYAHAAQMTNDDIAAFTTEDEKVAAVAAALRQQAVAAAAKVPGQCPATAEQAQALNQIR